MKTSLCVVGPLPPPRHGVSTVNESVVVMARDEGFVVTTFNTAPSSLDRSFWVRLGRLSRVVRALTGVHRFAANHPNAVVYLSLSGGWGLLYESVIAWRARRSGAMIVVHHHSFRYLDAPFWPMDLLIRAAGSGALHVVLGSLMAGKLRARYPIVSATLIASNAQYVGGEAKASKKLRRVGYLSNLSAVKGLEDVLATAESSQSRGWPLEFILAGPFENPSEEKKYRERMKLLGNVRYLGAVYGVLKEDFFRDIDVFLFPTRYRHEAEPLVVLEALSYARPVIAYARGCIPSLLIKGGHVVPREKDFVVEASIKLESWMRSESDFEAAGMAAGQRFYELKTQSLTSRHQLLDWFGKATSARCN